MIATKTQHTGGPAFPTTVRNHYDPETGGQWSEHIDQGMTLRDYFAAKAMQGMCVGAPVPQKSEIKLIATRSYEMADEMLKARGD
jgi:hypothetical protein